MSKINLDTHAENTWCPGCGNFGIISSVKNAITELIQEGIPKEKIVIGSGIGCHAKIADYMNINSFYTIHGRVIPLLTGMKLANNDLKLIGFSGDGDLYDEGMEHFIHAAKRNTDITIICHDNSVFALTTGQFTATSPAGFKAEATPAGSVENPINPIKLALAAGATFVARGYVGKPEHLKELIKKAVNHKGFAFIDVLQPCITFYNTFDVYNKKVYIMENHNVSDLDGAMKKSEEWKDKIPVGIFYEKQAKTFEDNF
jgi:2-oxoglutarate ferredoxin oxidoreductase subunit beta